jgi:hypothetical protein
MSTHLNQEMTFWKAVLAKLRRCAWQLDDDRAVSDEDRSLVADSYTLMLCVQSDVCDTLPLAVIETIISLITRETVIDVVSRYAELDSILIDAIQTDFADDLVKQFKPALGKFPHVGRWTWVLASMYHQCVLSLREPICVFRALHTCFSFIQRMTLSKREDLEKLAEESYLQKEEELQVQYPLIGLPLNHTMRCWFPDSITTYERLYGDWVPAHGNGSVAEGNLSVGEKYHELRMDSDLEYLDLLTGGLGYPRLIPPGLDRTAKVVFVPKSALKLRTICMEPAMLQFQQHAAMRALVRYIDRHPYLSTRIDLAHPEHNAEMARIGSIDGSYATIDLSAASDSVSLALVRSAFDGTPLYDILMCLRSTHTRYGDSWRIRTLKYAPMGSALCFPVECLIFCAIVEWAIRRAGGDPRRSDYCVYGDDIVVETEYASAVTTALELFGFSVNMSKSYYTERVLNYRESCGGEYILGEDVAPVRISRRFAGLSGLLGDASHYLGAIELANNLLGRCPHARLLIIQALNDLPRWARPMFVDIGLGGGIQSPTPTNFHLQQQVFVDPVTTPKLPYQRTRYRHGGVRASKGKIVEEDEDIRLYECLRSMAGAPDRDLLEHDQETWIDHQDTPHSVRRLTGVWSV